MGVGCPPRILGVGLHGPPVGCWVSGVGCLWRRRWVVLEDPERRQRGGSTSTTACLDPGASRVVRASKGRRGRYRSPGIRKCVVGLRERVVTFTDNRHQNRVGDDRAAYRCRIEATTTWVLSLGPRDVGRAVGWGRRRRRGSSGVVDGDSEGPLGCWGGKQSKTTKSPPCRPVSLAGLVEVGGLLAFCHTKLAGV